MSIWRTKIKDSIYSLMSFTDDECRIIEFKEPEENKAMTGHVIKSGEVDNQGSCRLMCYMEPNCVSINFGPSHDGKYTCQLNSATDEDHLQEKPNFTFLAIEVNISMAQFFFNASVMFSHCSYAISRRGYRSNQCKNKHSPEAHFYFAYVYCACTSLRTSSPMFCGEGTDAHRLLCLLNPPPPPPHLPTTPSS